MAQVENPHKAIDSAEPDVGQTLDFSTGRSEAYTSLGSANINIAREEQRAATEHQVALGNIPALQLEDFGSTRQGAQERDSGRGLGRLDGVRQNNDTGSGAPERTLAAAPGRGRVDQTERRDSRDHQRADDRPPLTLDRRASEGFVREHDRVVESVRREMPPGVRETLSNIHATPVRSVDRGRAAGVYDPETKELYLAERRPFGVSLESVAKHEFGHAFDFNQKDGKPLSENPEFRKLVDEGVKRDPQLRAMRREMGDEFYGEVFADLFARNLNAPRRDLSTGPIDQRMPAAQQWVRQHMN